MSSIKKLTVGLELECVRTSPQFHRLTERHNFGIRTDASILGEHGVALPRHGPLSGKEVVTPILEVEADLHTENGLNAFAIDYDNINATIKDLMACADYVNSSCGIHVHLGRPNGKESDWNPRRLEGQLGGPASEWKPGHVRTMLLIGLSLEDKLYSVVPESRKRSKHCKRIRDVYGNADFMAYYPVGTPVPRKHDNAKRYCWMNLIETRREADPEENRIGYARSKAFGTVEIRMLGETNNVEYVEAWVNLWIKIGMAVAYLPAETAALYCTYSSWLQPDFEKLGRLKDRHEQVDAPRNRIELPRDNGVIPVAMEEEG